MEAGGIERNCASSIENDKDSNYLIDRDDILESNDRFHCRSDEELNRFSCPNRELLVRHGIASNGAKFVTSRPQFLIDSSPNETFLVEKYTSCRYLM